VGRIPGDDGLPNQSLHYAFLNHVTILQDLVVLKSQFGIWGGSLVMMACLVKCLHYAFLNHVTLLQDCVVFKSQFGMWGGSLVMTACLVSVSITPS
jgi:hypothetical protein